MADPWFYCASIPELSAEAEAPVLVELDAAESKHAAGAKRLRAGDRVALFDGAGTRASVELVALSRGELHGHVLERWVESRPSPRIHLACALPKGDRQSTLLSMACQVGMSSFTPLSCRHSVSQPTTKATDRWERILREACKQSRRAYLPELCASASPEQVAQYAEGRGPCIVLHPDAPTLAIEESTPWRNAAEVWLLVGPEAGFASDELALLADHGARLARLGLASDSEGGILRIETAAIAALSVFSFAMSAT